MLLNNYYMSKLGNKVVLPVLIAAMLVISNVAKAEVTLEQLSFNTMLKGEVELLFNFNEPLPTKPSLQIKTDPTRIEIEFLADSFSETSQKTAIGQAGVSHIDVKKFGGKVIATIALDGSKQFKTSYTGSQYKVKLYDEDSAETGAKTEQKREFINKIASLDFAKSESGAGVFFINMEDSKLAVDVSERLGKIYVEFYNTEIADEFIALMDVTDFGTVVTQIESFSVGQNTRFVIETSVNFAVTHRQEENSFILEIAEGEQQASLLDDSENYTGKPISLNFQDIAVRTALQIIADINDFNLVITDSVDGSITLRLDNTPWDQALDIILKVKGLDKRMQGNILMVAPSDELAAREAKELQAKQQVTDLAPLHSEYIQINYAKASGFVSILKSEDTSLLSSRGSVTVDERTNTLLIRDTAKSIKDVKRMIEVLDVPVRQVVIESRMVTVKDNVSDELGIRWGVTQNDGDFGTAGTITGAANAANGVIPSTTDRLNVNLPVSNSAGSLAFQVARLADGTILDLELSALEQENKGEIIASPRITTANQKEAYIEQGTEIPYVQAASSGATTVTFKKAILGLKVTPQITPDNRVILDLVITQDTRGDTVSTGTGDAVAIDTQEIGTQVLVNNGETIVLGGIYQQQIINSVSKVPVLGDIPYFGWLFRKSRDFNEKKELLIFVTPRIISEDF